MAKNRKPKVKHKEPAVANTSERDDGRDAGVDSMGVNPKGEHPGEEGDKVEEVNPADERTGDGRRRFRNQGPAVTPEQAAQMRGEGREPEDQTAATVNVATPEQERVLTGVLFAVDESAVTLCASDGKSAGTTYSVTEGVEVLLNNSFTTAGDLKRGDKVTIHGDPVYGIEATR